MSEPYTPTTESIRRDYAEHRKDCMHSPTYEQSRRFREDGSGEGEFDRWFASEIEKAERKTLKRAEEAAAQALTTWWLTDTLPEDDTDSVMDVRRAIRSLRLADK